MDIRIATLEDNEIGTIDEKLYISYTPALSFMRVEWPTLARWHIHPLQEVLAFSEAVKNGFTSRSKTAADYGEEVEDIDIENARDMARTKELGLHYPVYPSLTDGSIPAGPVTEAGLKLQEMERKALIDALMKMAEAEAA